MPIKKLVFIITLLIILFQTPAHAQLSGKPVMGKMAQYTMLGGLTGAGLFTAIWLSDPLGNLNLGELALQGMSVGVVIGFALGAYVVYTEATNVPVSQLDQRVREKEQQKQRQEQKQKDPEFLDFGDVFDSDKNYFEQIDQYNYIPQWDYLPPKYDPTRQDPKKPKDMITYNSPIFHLSF